MKKKLAKLMAVLTFLGATGIFYSCDSGQQKASVFDTKETSEVLTTGSAETSKNTEEEKPVQTTALKEIYVYVCGQVKKPGVYTLQPGARVTDAIKAAGGFTKNAYSEGINLAKTVNDEEQLYVPSQEEAKEYEGQAHSSSVPENSEKESESNDGKTTGKININTASKEELLSLPGIGESKADRIISYREANGSFAAIDDIMKVAGIKTGVFTKIKKYITVE